MRPFFVRKPRYSKERALLSDAIASGALDCKQNLRDCTSRVEKIMGWDSILDGGDWIELDMEANERDLQVDTVEDFLKLLTAIDSAGPSTCLGGPPDEL